MPACVAGAVSGVSHPLTPLSSQQPVAHVSADAQARQLLSSAVAVSTPVVLPSVVQASAPLELPTCECPIQPAGGLSHNSRALLLARSALAAAKSNPSRGSIDAARSAIEAARAATGTTSGNGTLAGEQAEAGPDSPTTQAGTDTGTGTSSSSGTTASGSRGAPLPVPSTTSSSVSASAAPQREATASGSTSETDPDLDADVRRAQLVVLEMSRTLEALQSRGAVSVPDIANAVCAATLRATAPSRAPPPRRGCADDAAAVMEGSPYDSCPPGPWAAVGRRVGDPHAAPLCTCGERDCRRGHFPVVDVFELYDMHCQHVCGAHEIDPSGHYLYPEAHVSCPIHTKLTLLSGAWVPFKSPGDIPTQQLRSRPITVAADSDDGRFVTEQIAKGIALDLWEELSDAEVADFQRCSIVESAFPALVGKLQLSAVEASTVRDDGSTPDVPAINALAAARAQVFVDSLSESGPAPDKAAFAQAWAAQGGGSKRRLCVAHNRFLNPLSRGWSLSFTTPYAILETSQLGDVFIVRDHKGGYHAVPIRPDQRRYFCFYHPVTGRVLRCKRLDFGWALAPGIFCSFTAEINAIVSSRLMSEVHPRALSRYYVGDCNARVPRGGGPPLPSPPSPVTDLFSRAQSANESRAVAILVDTQSRANFLTAPEKDNIGDTVPYLGVVVSSSSRSAIVLPSKIFKTLTMVHILLLVATLALAVSIPRSFALKAAGNTQWLAQNFRLGRLHTSALWLTAELLRRSPSPALQSCPGLLDALQWWAAEAAAGRLQPHRFVEGLDIPSLTVYFREATQFLAETGVVFGVPLPILSEVSTRQVIALLHDASGELTSGAVGGCWRAPGSAAIHAFYYQLSPEERGWPSIAPKELRALVEWIERFGHRYPGAVLLAGTDNAGNVFTVNRLRVSATDTVMTSLLSRLLAAADRWGIDVIVWWCPRALNGISDSLSKSPSLASARRVATRLGLVLHDGSGGDALVPL